MCTAVTNDVAQAENFVAGKHWALAPAVGRLPSVWMLVLSAIRLYAPCCFRRSKSSLWIRADFRFHSHKEAFPWKVSVMVATIDLEASRFSHRIFVKGLSKNPDCGRQFDNNTDTMATVEIKFGSCGMNRERKVLLATGYEDSRFLLPYVLFAAGPCPRTRRIDNTDRELPLSVRDQTRSRLQHSVLLRST